MKLYTVFLPNNNYSESILKHLGGGGGGLVAKSCLTLVTPWTVAPQAPLSMGFSRQESWGGLPFPSPLNTLIPRQIPHKISYAVISGQAHMSIHSQK